MAETSLLSTEIIGMITTVISFVVGMLARQPAYQKVKAKFSQSKEFLTHIDDALYDNKVTEEEFRKIFDSGKKLVDRD